MSETITITAEITLDQYRKIDEILTAGVRRVEDVETWGDLIDASDKWMSILGLPLTFPPK